MPHKAWIKPDWPAADTVRGLVTTRMGGFSEPPFDSFNLAAHVDDAHEAVEENRRLLRQYVPSEPLWLNQVHSNTMIDAGERRQSLLDADGSFSTRAKVVCAVLTADCLPVLLCNRQGSGVAALHAGWRGLAAGILEQGVSRLTQVTNSEPGDILVWLGPAIGPGRFEVGEDVRQAFLSRDQAMGSAFSTITPDGHAGKAKWLADIYQLARLKLARIGVDAVYGGNFCTYDQAELFYSYRRDGMTGRMASLVWLENPAGS